jgi:hypothetical protein
VKELIEGQTLKQLVTNTGALTSEQEEEIEAAEINIQAVIIWMK